LGSNESHRLRDTIFVFPPLEEKAERYFEDTTLTPDDQNIHVLKPGSTSWYIKDKEILPEPSQDFEYTEIKQGFHTYTGIEARFETEKQRAKQDNINKVFLRMIRRFFHKIFMKENQNLSRRRFININYNQQLQGWKSMIQKYLKPEKNSDELAGYLLKLLNLKARNIPNTLNEGEKDGIELSNTLKSFSRNKFSKIHHNPFFREIFNYIYNGFLPGWNKKWIEELYKNEVKNIRKNKLKYEECFNRMHFLCQAHH